MTQTVVLECSKGKKLKTSAEDWSAAMIGKTQKFSSKGQSGMFVTDFSHAVETVGETEGFSSPGHVDSEDSCTPKRKCISLNADHCFNVPLQVISVSKMSGSERQELKRRLSVELEQVQMVQRKILSRIATVPNGVALSSTSSGHVKNGSQLKRGVMGRFETSKQSQVSKQSPPTSAANSDAVVMKQCETILKTLMTHKYSWVFNTPVDVVKLKIPDYFNVIKHPMDLGTIKKKLETSAYSSPLEFVSDVRLTFTNAMTYNPAGNDVHIMADALNKLFDKKWKPIEKKLPPPVVDVKREIEAVKPVSSQPKKRKAPPMKDIAIVSESVKKPKMTFEQKQKLTKGLCDLQDALQDGLSGPLLDFIKEHTKQTREDEIEIDLESLSDEALFELQKLIDEYMRANHSAPVEKVEPCEMEILNESGLSNASMHPCKGNEPADEDVDIGGNDPPVSSYPPVEIEKDAAPRSSKCSSSSSSGSGSDSSSSDSDTGSSSGSESDAKIESPKVVKENGQFGTVINRERSDAVNPLDGTGTFMQLDQCEQGARPKAESIEADNSQEGENAPSERQVSPDKLYRQAWLKGRFADTIVKAREKTLNQGEKRDPEKLRREREELERQQRAEKARLQAEAKAAEDARRRAEAEAAAEAKRKRELEREAARKALLEMEKSVQIHENSIFLQDLQMLGTGPSEHIVNSVDKMMTDRLEEGIEGFKLGGSNPLEQLGLYMKDEEEEEEEVGPSSTVPASDFEEGEID